MAESFVLQGPLEYKNIIYTATLPNQYKNRYYKRVKFALKLC